MCIASGLVVDTDDRPNTDFLPVSLANEEELDDRRESIYDAGMIGRPLHDVDEVAETTYNSGTLVEKVTQETPQPFADEAGGKRHRFRFY